MKRPLLFWLHDERRSISSFQFSPSPSLATAYVSTEKGLLIYPSHAILLVSHIFTSPHTSQEGPVDVPLSHEIPPGRVARARGHNGRAGRQGTYAIAAVHVYGLTLPTGLVRTACLQDWASHLYCCNQRRGTAGEMEAHNTSW